MQKLRAHPDLGGDTAKALLINEAYETLSDSEKRHQYDRQHAPWFERLKHRKSASTHRSASNSWTGNDGHLDDLECKRTIHRTALGGVIKVHIQGRSNAIPGQISDLSPKGMRLVANIDLEMDDVIKIEGQMINAVARVTSCVPDGSKDHDPFAIGVEFISVRFSRTQGSFVSSAA